MYFLIVVVFVLQLLLLMLVLLGTLDCWANLSFLFDKRLKSYLTHVAFNIALFKRLYCISSVVINGGIDTFHGQLV